MHPLEWYDIKTTPRFPQWVLSADAVAQKTSSHRTYSQLVLQATVRVTSPQQGNVLVSLCLVDAFMK